MMSQKAKNYSRFVFSTAVAALALAASSSAQVNVLTNRYDTFRTGANPNEKVLNTANVGGPNFGKLFSYNVDGQVYAQPLVARAYLGPKLGTKNVLFIATAHNTVYAFDADATSSATKPIWQINLGPSVPNRDVGSNDMSPEIGIVSTPVVDLGLQTIFVVAKTKEGGTYQNRLHAIDITTGRPRRGSGVAIAGSVPGTGDGAQNGRVTFSSYYQMNRPGLLLLNGKIYIAFGSHGDMRPYHGWVFGYDARTLGRTAIHCSNPNGGMGGIWQSGTGLSANAAGEIFYQSGNGSLPNEGGSLGNSFVKLGVTRDANLVVKDSFTPYDSELMNWYDLDLGTSGPIVIPGTNLVMGGGKYGGLYFVDQNNMGGYSTTGNAIPQNVPAMGGHLHAAPVFLRGTTESKVFLWSEDDVLKQYTFKDGRLSNDPTSTGALRMSWGMPGGMLSASANGTQAGSAVLWASFPTNQNANQQTVAGTFRAYDAMDLSKVLWSSDNDSRDDVGNFAKYVTPVVANGRVYMASFSNKVHVYGLRANTTAIGR
ncbi:MAG: hypothetical protein ACOYON_04055 [Fimbriimonas sp.]